MLTQTAKSIFKKKIEPLDAISVSKAFASRSAIRVHTPTFALNVMKWKPDSPPLSKTTQQPVTNYRASVITGKKALGKLAVPRNRARRRILSAAQHCFPEHAIPGKLGTLFRMMGLRSQLLASQYWVGLYNFKIGFGG
jgi:ribonuclease P protein component